MADNTTNEAIYTLELRKKELTEGVVSIPEQKKSLERLRKQIEVDEERLASDKKSLLQINEALAILKAGEDG